MEWHIQPRSLACAICQRKFVDKQRYQTTLYSQGDNGYRREDICMECEGESNNEKRSFTVTDINTLRKKENFISQWKGIIQITPSVVKSDSVQRDKIEVLLRSIIAQNSSKYKNASYILAIMLERKRILKVKDVYIDHQKKITLYEQSKTGDIFAIEDPGLNINQLDEVQKEICDVLERGVSNNEISISPAVNMEENILFSRIQIS